jgi:hypothetical protein
MNKFNAIFGKTTYNSKPSRPLLSNEICGMEEKKYTFDQWKNEILLGKESCYAILKTNNKKYESVIENGKTRGALTKGSVIGINVLSVDIDNTESDIEEKGYFDLERIIQTLKKYNINPNLIQESWTSRKKKVLVGERFIDQQKFHLFFILNDELKLKIDYKDLDEETLLQEQEAMWASYQWYYKIFESLLPVDSSCKNANRIIYNSTSPLLFEDKEARLSIESLKNIMNEFGNPNDKKENTKKTRTKKKKKESKTAEEKAEEKAKKIEAKKMRDQLDEDENYVTKFLSDGSSVTLRRPQNSGVLYTCNAYRKLQEGVYPGYDWVKSLHSLFMYFDYEEEARDLWDHSTIRKARPDYDADHQHEQAIEANHTLWVKSWDIIRELSLQSTKYGGSPIYIENGCYYARGKESDYTITDFTFEILGTIEDRDYAAVEAKIHSAFNERFDRTVLLDMESFSDKKRFHKLLVQNTFTGNEKHLLLLKKMLMQQKIDDNLIKKAVDCVGLHKYEKEWYYTSEEKTIDKNGENFDKLVLRNDVAEIESDILDQEVLTKEEYLSTFEAVIKGYDKNYMLTAMGFCAAYLAYPMILSHEKIKRPHLMLIGESESGKSTVLEGLIQPFFNIAGAESAEGITPFAVTRNMSSSNALPFIIDEWKPSRIENYKKNLVSSIVRTSYDGLKKSRGSKDMTANKKFLARNTLVLAGEEGFTEKAVNDRSIILHFARTKMSGNKEYKEFKKSTSNIKRMGKTTLLHILGTNDKKLYDLYNKNLQFLLKNGGTYSRLNYNLVFISTGLDIISSFLGIDLTKEKKEVIELHLERAKEEKADTLSEVEKVLYEFDKLIEKNEFFEGKDFKITKDKLYIRVNIIYDKIRKYHRDITGENLISEKDFRKQLSLTEYFLKANSSMRVSDYKRANDDDGNFDASRSGTVQTNKSAFQLDLQKMRDKFPNLNNLLNISVDTDDTDIDRVDIKDEPSEVVKEVSEFFQSKIGE